MEANIEQYITERVDDQFAYFDSSAMRNQRSYKRFKSIAITCNVLTTMTIAVAFTVPQIYKVPMGILALILSTIVLATYQIEEFQSYGAKWEKFRLVAEQLKSEKLMFVNRVGPYATVDPEDAKRLFIETVEGVIRGTDISYFSLMVEPGKRIEKRLQQKQESN
jgi:CTP synthase (UTP-ammonia lyase)